MTLRLALCFLFHQPLSEHAARASRICYRGVLGVLRNHPSLKFNLMLSGTLLDALCWFDRPLLRTVRRGIADGSFRLLGSTYAQNLIAAGEDWDNNWQIMLHRRCLKKLFDAEPEAFWSPARIWNSRMADILPQAGYRFLPLEDRVLRAAGVEDPAVHACRPGRDGLQLLWEDLPLRTRLEYATWFRRGAVFEEAISAWKAHPEQARLFPVCCEDAAAFGLWGYEIGLDPRADWLGLDRLLDAVARMDGVATAFLEEAPTPARMLEAVPAGWGADLDRALNDPDASNYEEGYSDWRDFVSRSPRIRHFRRIHTAIRSRMQSAEERVAGREAKPPDPGRALFDLAARVYCAHQSQFGAVGVGGRGDPAWEGVGAAITVAKAAELAGTPPDPAGRGVIDDVTGDGEDEILLYNGSSLAVLSPYGGRLLHWINLREGSLHIGNPLAVPIGTLLIEAHSPEQSPLPDDWEPVEGEPPGDAKRESPPGRRGNRLHPGQIPADGEPLPYWPRPQMTGLRPSLPARRRALNDFFSLDEGPEQPPEPRLDFRMSREAVTFLRFFGYRLRMTKRVRLTSSGLRTLYRFWAIDNRVVSIRLRTVSELCPDYQRILDCSGKPLEPVRFGSRAQPGIRNRRTGRILVCHASRTPSGPVAFQRGILAWEVAQEFVIHVEPGKEETLILRFNLYPAVPAEKETSMVKPVVL